MASQVPVASPVPDLPGAFWAVVPLPEVPDPSPLTPAERTLFESFHTDRRRSEWLAGRLAARSALRAVGGGACSILRGPEGGPRLEGPGHEGVEVAITHGEGQAAAIATRKDAPWPFVGIDWVDARDAARIRRIAGRVLSPAEKALAEDRDLALQLAWGAREAVAKATRTGMFVYALAHVCLVAFDEQTGIAEVSTLGPSEARGEDPAGVRVRFRALEGGPLVVVAGVSSAARTEARRIAFRERGPA